MFWHEQNQNVPAGIFRKGWDLERNEICSGVFWFFFTGSRYISHFKQNKTEKMLECLASVCKWFVVGLCTVLFLVLIFLLP
jgi:hypothetical protein